jgi:hypothetical protein
VGVALWGTLLLLLALVQRVGWRVLLLLLLLRIF